MYIYVELFSVALLSSTPCSFRRFLFLRIKVTAVHILFHILHAIMVTVPILIMCLLIAFPLTMSNNIQSVPGGKDLTSGECSLGQTIPI